MSTRLQVIEALGSKCHGCSEERVDALTVATTIERTSTWERYWQDVLQAAQDSRRNVALYCRNCNAVEYAAARRRRALRERSGGSPGDLTPPYYIVQAPVPEWTARLQRYVRYANGEYRVMPDDTPYHGPQVPPDPETGYTIVTEYTR